MATKILPASMTVVTGDHLILTASQQSYSHDGATRLVSGKAV